METRISQYLLSLGIVILIVANLQNCDAKATFTQKTDALTIDTGLSQEIKKQVRGKI